MGFLKDLFLGTKPKLTVKQADLTSPEQQQALNALLSQLGRQQPRSFEGQRTAPMGEGEMTSLSALEERARALAVPSQNLGAAGGSIRDLLDFRGQTADASAFFRSNVQDPMLEQFQREILPKISRQFGGSEFFTSERQATEGLAREDLLQSLTGARTSVELDQFNQARDRAIKAAGIVPQLEQAEQGNIQALIDIIDAQGIPREIQQAGLDREYAEFVRQAVEAGDIQKLLALLTTAQTKENIGAASPGSEGLISKFLGSLVSGAGTTLGGKVPTPSDRRLKRSIVRIGTHPLGIGLYEFDYVWGEHSTGVMADEVRCVMPQAVITIGGYDAVNYAMLGG